MTAPPRPAAQLTLPPVVLPQLVRVVPVDPAVLSPLEAAERCARRLAARFRLAAWQHRYARTAPAWCGPWPAVTARFTTSQGLEEIGELRAAIKAVRLGQQSSEGGTG